MGRSKSSKKDKFNKKQSIRFALVAGPQQNGKPTTRFEPLGLAKNSIVSSNMREKLIKQISDDQYDDIEINGKKVIGQGAQSIPSFILDQIRGRKDLVFNNLSEQGSSSKRASSADFTSFGFKKQGTDGNGSPEEMQGDLYDVRDANQEDQEWFEDDYSEGQWDQEQQRMMIQEEQNEQDYEDYSSDQNDEQLNKDGKSHQKNDKNEGKTILLQMKQSDFPSLQAKGKEDAQKLVKYQENGKQYYLTEEQLKLLDVVLPENYESFQIQGLKFQKYNEDGLPLSKIEQYRQFMPTGKEGIVDSFQYVPEKPLPIYDNDLKPSQIKGEMREIEDALNFEEFEGTEGVEGKEQQGYEQLEDDFFAQMIKAEIDQNKKKKKRRDKSSATIATTEGTKKKTTKVTSVTMPSEQRINQLTGGNVNAKLPKILQANCSNGQVESKQNIFAKYEELDEDHLESQITDEMIEKALDDFQMNIEPEIKQNKHEKMISAQDDQDDSREDLTNQSNVSTNFAEIESREEYQGRDGELDWRCLTKKEKKQYMRTKIIKDFYDEVREREIDDKLKGKKNVTAQELHLKNIIKRIPFKEDHVMQSALERDAQVHVDMNEPFQPYSDSSTDQDITEYHTRTSIIATSLNQVNQDSTQQAQRKKKLKQVRKKKRDEERQQRQKQMEEMSMNMSQLSQMPIQKRPRKQTPEERKARKEKLKQIKKQKKQLKKEFSEKFSEERSRQLKMKKPTDALHKISYVKII